MPKYDVVIWLAAIVGDGACTVDPFLTQSINEDTVEWLVDNYSGKVVFPSTCSVYGINNDLIDESAPTHPLSMYAITKLAAEHTIVATTRTTSCSASARSTGWSDRALPHPPGPRGEHPYQEGHPR